MMKIKIILTLLTTLLLGCTCLKQKSVEKDTNLKEDKKHIEVPFVVESKKQVVRGNLAQVEPAIVYKTKADYYDKVPIILSDDKKSVVSYPAPTDVYYRGKLAYPIKLKNGYLLDNRGINKNVAFTKYTYNEYSKLTASPTEKDLLNSVIDNSPLLNLVNLGPRIYFEQDEVGEINQIIDTGFKDYKQLKDELKETDFIY